jgi:hypothetical protein
MSIYIFMQLSTTDFKKVKQLRSCSSEHHRLKTGSNYNMIFTLRAKTVLNSDHKKAPNFRSRLFANVMSGRF